MRDFSFLVVGAVGFYLLFGSHSSGQGALTPPGPPQPTMKSLSEIAAQVAAAEADLSDAKAKLDILNGKAESRTPISSIPRTISSSGSYYFAGTPIGRPGAKGLNITDSRLEPSAAKNSEGADLAIRPSLFPSEPSP